MRGADLPTPARNVAGTPAARHLENFRRALVQASGDLWRDLPWRATRDPWQILVSEVMLQQTQVPRVVAPFLRFVARFPTPAACAAAGPAEVVRAWAGLGYNRRALNLHRAATVVVDQHGGAVPDDLAALLALPGVGPYTARAVLAFAFGRPIGVVDTNVARVLARAVAGRALKAKESQSLADRLVPSEDAWRFNQALFDLGARFCTAAAPRCASCPLRAWCRFGQKVARQDGRPTSGDGGGDADPAVAPRRQAPFAGSDRQGRGRLVEAMRAAPVPLPALPSAAGWPGDPPRALRIAHVLVEEGLACWREGALALS